MAFKLSTVILAALVAASQSDITNDTSFDAIIKDTDETISNRIIGGRDALENEFPWMASLHYDSKYLCSAFLITPSLIMTAAHCARYGDGPENSSKFSGFIGTIKNGDSGTKLRFRKISIHPKYGSGTGNDIALMRLESPVALNSSIQTICLPTKNSDYESTIAQIMGWGFYRRGVREGANTLQTATSPVTKKSFCDGVFARMGIKLTNEHICAGGEPNKGICNGDSGGPLVSLVPSKPVAIGVTAFVSVYGCAVSDNPAVFSATSMFTDWIKEVAGNEASNLCFLYR